MAQTDKFFYICGGVDDSSGEPINTIEGYSFSPSGVFTNLSEPGNTLATIPLDQTDKHRGATGIHGTASTTVTGADGNLYLVIAGGTFANEVPEDADDIVPGIWIYRIDPDTGALTEKTVSLPNATFHGAFAPFMGATENGWIILAGGVAPKSDGTQNLEDSKKIYTFKVGTNGSIESLNEATIQLSQPHFGSDGTIVGNSAVFVGVCSTQSGAETITVAADGTVVSATANATQFGGAAVAAVNDKYVVACGGYASSTGATENGLATITVWEVDSAGHVKNVPQNSPQPALSKARAFAGATAVNGFVVAAGGATGVSTAGAYPIATGFSPAVDFIYVDEYGQATIKETRQVSPAFLPNAAITIGDYAVLPGGQIGDTVYNIARKTPMAFRVIAGAPARLTFAFGGDVWPEDAYGVADTNVLPLDFYTTVGATLDPNTECVPTKKEGYTFERWYMDKSLYWPYNYSTVFGPCTLYAKYVVS
jgi:hypothetical protein